MLGYVESAARGRLLCFQAALQCGRSASIPPYPMPACAQPALFCPGPAVRASDGPDLRLSATGIIRQSLSSKCDQRGSRHFLA